MYLFSTISTGRTPIARVSQKQRQKIELRARIRKDKVKKLGRGCQIQSPVCRKWEQGLHHLKKKSQGGHDSDANTLLCCRRCNNFIENHPVWAREHGFTRRS